MFLFFFFWPRNNLIFGGKRNQVGSHLSVLRNIRHLHHPPSRYSAIIIIIIRRAAVQYNVHKYDVISFNNYSENALRARAIFNLNVGRYYNNIIISAVPFNSIGGAHISRLYDICGRLYTLCTPRDYDGGPCRITIRYRLNILFNIVMIIIITATMLSSLSICANCFTVLVNRSSPPPRRSAVGERACVRACSAEEG